MLTSAACVGGVFRTVLLNEGYEYHTFTTCNTPCLPLMVHVTEVDKHGPKSLNLFVFQARTHI